jgi:hypothetical protein
MNKKSALSTAGVLAILLSPSASTGAIVFESDLDTGAGWFVVQEATNPSSLAAFGYDYSGWGIPPSPNGGGTTVGLRLTANALGNVQAITAATTATFSGQYKVTFDFWGNTNGPLPVGGTGSTEHLGGGVGFFGALPRKGASSLISIEGNVGGTNGLDWRLDKDSAGQLLTSGFYNPAITTLNISSATSTDPGFFFNAPFPGQSAPAAQGVTGTAYNGTIAFGWHTMTILVDSDAGTAEFTIDSTVLGTINQSTGAVSTAGSGTLTLLDSFNSISSPDLTTDPVFAVFDNYKVESVPEPAVASLLAFAILPLLRRRRMGSQS